MSTFNYARLRAVADRLLVQFGRTALLVKKTATGGDPWSPTLETTTHEIKAALFDYTAREREGTSIQQGDRRVLISAEGIPATPESEDEIDIDGLKYAIVVAEKIEPGDAGTVVLFDCQVRR